LRAITARHERISVALVQPVFIDKELTFCWRSAHLARLEGAWIDFLGLLLFHPDAALFLAVVGRVNLNGVLAAIDGNDIAHCGRLRLLRPIIGRRLVGFLCIHLGAILESDILNALEQFVDVADVGEVNLVSAIRRLGGVGLLFKHDNTRHHLRTGTLKGNGRHLDVGHHVDAFGWAEDFRALSSWLDHLYLRGAHARFSAFELWRGSLNHDVRLVIANGSEYASDNTRRSPSRFRLDCVAPVDWRGLAVNRVRGQRL